MEASVKQAIERCAQGSHAGTMHFGAVVEALLAAGVEAYQTDYRRRTITYYLPSGDTLVLELHAPQADIPTPFRAEALQAAIRGSQRGEVKYPEFLERSMAAGCVGYFVWLAGRHVTYLGRLGESHTERFPTPS